MVLDLLSVFLSRVMLQSARMRLGLEPFDRIYQDYVGERSGLSDMRLWPA